MCPRPQVSSALGSHRPRRWNQKLRFNLRLYGENQEFGLLPDPVSVEQPYNIIDPGDGCAINRQNEVSLLKTTTFGRALRLDTAYTHRLASPPPRVFSDDLTADKTVLTLQYWATTSEWSETRYDMIDALKDGLRAEGVALK